jgi:DNA-binding MarR family transcriptional regulator
MSKDDQIQSIIECLSKIQRPVLSTRWKEIGLSHAQVGMLYLLSHHKQSNVKQTADFLGISKSAVTQLADPLESKGLISRSNDQADRRIVWLSLTPSGSKVLKTIAKHKFDGLRSALETISADELDSLHRIYTKLAGAVNTERTV